MAIFTPRQYRSLPELFDTASQRIVHFARDSPLRPEFLESTFHLYGATGDPHYLEVGREQLHALQNLTRVECGFASIADVRTHKLDDRMDSYVIAETLKYLWLLFDHGLEPEHRSSLFCPSLEDEARPHFAARNETRPCLNSSRTLFSTEGHIFVLPASTETSDDETCPFSSSLASAVNQTAC